MNSGGSSSSASHPERGPGSPPRASSLSRSEAFRRASDRTVAVIRARQRAASAIEGSRPSSRLPPRIPSEIEAVPSITTPSDDGFRGLEGPPTASGERQTLQEFLQTLDISSLNEGQERPNHRHSMSTFTPDSTRSREREHHRPSRSSRRRSTQPDINSPQIWSPAHGELPPSPSPVPLTPPPSYERYDRRVRPNQEEGRDPHPGRRISMDTMSSSTYFKPKWQPDVEVSECPICRTAFGFFFRKHHCRKCGRVVCANCSPHRITIPKQYIVEPPAEGSEGEQQETLRAEAGDDNAPIFGGQEVRLCNPCVPDPNPLPPPDYTTSAQHILSTFPPQNFPASPVDQGQARPQYPRRSSSQREWVGPYSTATAPSSRQRSATESFLRSQYSPSGLRTPSRRQTGVDLPEPGASSTEATPDGRPPRRQGYYGHRHRPAASTSAIPTNWHFENPRDAPLPPRPVQPPPRQIAEEDECPICHEELPPKGPDNDETAREMHVNDCIARHSAPGAAETLTTPTTPTGPSHPLGATSSSAPSSGWQPPSGPRSRADSAAASSGFPTPSPGPTRPRADTAFSGTSAMPARRRANMLVYHATEKDCLDAEGRPRECIICLDEFVEGAELGRLECWCVFHRACIREWWDQKGPGACPTHQTGI